MRVLVAHNRYRSALPSGENALVDREIDALRARGVDVAPLLADSDDIDDFGMRQRLGLAVAPIRSAEGKRRYDAVRAAGPPDVVHVHNPYPLISPALVRWAHDDGIPVVQTVHNVRHACLPGSFARDGRECRDCEGRRVPWPGVVHRCYRGSWPQSVVMGVANVRHRPTWRTAERFLAVSDYVADVLVGTGIAADRVVVRPNGVPDPGPPTPPGDGVLCAGRLSIDKGVDALLDLWEREPPTGLRLRLAGEGDLRPRVEAVADRVPSVEYLGRITRAEVGEAITAAAVVVVPSRVPEALPTVVLEAFARGRPVVASPVGAVPGMVDDSVGALARVAELGDALATVAADATARGTAARQRYLDRYTEARALDALLDTYASLS